MQKQTGSYFIASNKLFHKKQGNLLEQVQIGNFNYTYYNLHLHFINLQYFQAQQSLLHLFSVLKG